MKNKKPDKLVVQRVIDMLNNPDEAWSFNKYTATHTSGLAVWIANMPVFHTEIYQPTRLKPSMFERWQLWKAVKAARYHYIARLTTPTKTPKSIGHPPPV